MNIWELLCLFWTTLTNHLELFACCSLRTNQIEFCLGFTACITVHSLCTLQFHVSSFTCSPLLISASGPDRDHKTLAFKVRGHVMAAECGSIQAILTANNITEEVFFLKLVLL